MTTAITATQVPPALGFFDTQILLGIPLWVFVNIFLVFILLTVLVYWILRMSKLKPVRGWSESLKSMGVGECQVWILSRTQKLIIDCMKIEDNILSYRDKTKLGMWHHHNPLSVVKIGGNPALVVSEEFDHTRDMISEIALTDGCDEFNKNIEDLSSTTSNTVKPIEDYKSYEEHGRELLQQVHPEGLPTKSYNIFSNVKFLKYFPLGCSHMFLGADITLEAKFLKGTTKQQGFWEKHAVFAGAIIVVALAFIAVWFVPLK